MEHAERSGEPVEYDPAFDYGHDFYEKPSPPDPIYSFVRGDDTILGFQIAEIEPFLARHGLRGFDAVKGIVALREHTVSTTAQVDRGRKLIWWKDEYDIFELAQDLGNVAHDKMKRAVSPACRTREKPTSSNSLAKVVAARIADDERRRRTDRCVSARTVRKALTGWEYKPPQA